MKVLMINEGALSDLEVRKLMQERRDSRLHKSAVAAYAERNWMDHKVLKYLGHAKSAGLDERKVQAFLHAVERRGLALTPAEKLQFLNHCPTELVDIHLIVEDCAGRFSEEQINELAGIVDETLGAAAKEPAGDQEMTAKDEETKAGDDA